MDHFANSVFAAPGRCWRLVTDFAGRPEHCAEPVVRTGRHRLSGREGRVLHVWSCEGAPGGARGGATDSGLSGRRTRTMSEPFLGGPHRHLKREPDCDCGEPGTCLDHRSAELAPTMQVVPAGNPRCSIL